jgi:hypothetical protein
LIAIQKARDRQRVGAEPGLQPAYIGKLEVEYPAGSSHSTRAVLPTCDTCGASGSGRRARTLMRIEVKVEMLQLRLMEKKRELVRQEDDRRYLRRHPDHIRCAPRGERATRCNIERVVRRGRAVGPADRRWGGRPLQSRFDQVGLAFSVTVVLFVKAFCFQRDQRCEHSPLFVRDARIGKLSLDEDQVRVVDELFHRPHERLPVPARDAIS